MKLVKELGKTFHLIKFKSKQGINIFLVLAVMRIGVVSFVQAKQSVLNWAPAISKLAIRVESVSKAKAISL